MVDAVGKKLDLSSLELAPPAPLESGELGQEEFLHLMITQLKNQDPFKPLESGEFLGQLAQFGTVSGLATLQTSFEDLATSLVSNQALQAAALVGRSALVERDAITLEKDATVSGAVELEARSTGVEVRIQDARGEVVRRIVLGEQPAGLARFDWDGKNDDGKRVDPGRYTIVAQYRKDKEVAAGTTLVAAPVESVVFGAQGFSVRLRGLGEVPFTAVREIRTEPSNSIPDLMD
jgi:flagellar basal-body rod modification protein FlgD